MERAPDVAGVEFGATVAHPGVVDGLVAVASRAGEGEVERAGNCGFLPAGIRRSVLPGVARHHPRGASAVRAGQQPGRGHEVQAREAGGQPVHRIVEPCRRGAEVSVALGAMPDHAVQSVDGLVGDEPRQAGQSVPEQRRHHPVGEVLGHRFDRAARDARLVQTRRVAADDVAHRLPARVEAPVEPVGHREGMIVEPAKGDQRAGDHSFQHPAMGPARNQETLDGPAGRDAGSDHHRHRRGATEPAEPAGRRPVQPTFRQFDELAEPHHRMRYPPIEPRGITHSGIDEQRRQHDVKFEPGTTHGGGIRPQGIGRNQESTE